MLRPFAFLNRAQGEGMKKDSTMKCGWSKPCEKPVKAHSIVFDDRKSDVLFCDQHWVRLRMGDFDPLWFARLLRKK